MNKIIVFCGFFLVVFFTSQAQVIDLEEAIQIALDQNPRMKIAELTVDTQIQQKRTSFDLPKTDVDVTIGSFNGIQVNDYYLTISQSFSFPTVYTSQSKLNQAMIESAESRLAVERNLLIQEVKTRYYQLLANYQKLQILQKQDSLFTLVAAEVQEELPKNADYPLSNLSLEVQLKDVQNNMHITEADMTILQDELRKLLNYDKNEVFSIADQEMTQRLIFLDTLTLEKNPDLALLQKNINIEERNIARQKANFSPDLRIGYVDLSVGLQTGFNGFLAGISIPLYPVTLKANVNQAKIQKDIAELNYEYSSNILEQELDIQLHQLDKYAGVIEYYLDYALPQAQLISVTSLQNYRLDTIEYIEFLQNQSQVFSIQQAYVDSLLQYNLTVIAIEFLIGN